MPRTSLISSAMYVRSLERHRPLVLTESTKFILTMLILWTFLSKTSATAFTMATRSRSPSPSTSPIAPATVRRPGHNKVYYHTQIDVITLSYKC